MPARTVRKRVDSVERTLTAASDFLTSRNVQEITAQRGQILFEREDIDRCLEFQTTLRNRFAQDLQLLDPKIELNP
jgi:hypothetical protein